MIICIGSKIIQKSTGVKRNDTFWKRLFLKIKIYLLASSMEFNRQVAIIQNLSMMCFFRGANSNFEKKCGNFWRRRSRSISLSRPQLLLGAAFDICFCVFAFIVISVSLIHLFPSINLLSPFIDSTNLSHSHQLSRMYPFISFFFYYFFSLHSPSCSFLLPGCPFLTGCLCCPMLVI